MERKYLVYKHTNLINGKNYIGITYHIENPNIRWEGGSGYIQNDIFFKDILFYGWNNFSHEILETNISEDEIIQKEIEYIKQYEGYTKGYNRSPGGQKLSEESCKKISEALTGIKRSPISITKQINTKIKNTGFANGFDPKNSALVKKVKCKETGDIFCSEVEANKWANTCKLGDCCNGNRFHAGVHPITGQKLSWEFAKDNEDVTIRCTEKRIPKTIKKIQCIESGEIFNCATDAFRQTGIATCNILRVCRGERKTAGKLHWKFYEEGE